MTISVTKRLSYAIDGVEVAAFSLHVSESELDRAISLTTLKEVRAMATALENLQAATAANAAQTDLLQAKVDAAVQLIVDLKAAVAGAGSNDPALVTITALLNGETAKIVAAEGGLDSAVAP